MIIQETFYTISEFELQYLCQRIAIMQSANGYSDIEFAVQYNDLIKFLIDKKKIGSFEYSRKLLKE